MKKIHLILPLFIISILSSCEDELDRFTMFDVNNESQFTIASTTVIETPFGLNTPEIESTSNNDFQNNNSRKNLVESAKIKSLRLTIETPEDGNFDFLNEIELFIDAEGLDEVKLAGKFEIPENGSNTLPLDVESNTELRDYLKTDSYSIRVRAVTDEIINRNHTIRINSTFFVDAKIFGI